MELTAHQNHMIWMDFAVPFYLGSRSLHFNELYSPAEFCGFQALETMLKALLFYYVVDFNPKEFSHKMESLIEKVEEVVPNAKGKVHIQPYFYFKNKYQSLTRYPDPYKGVTHFINYLYDLDMGFYSLLILGPHPTRGKIRHIIKEENKYHNLFVRENQFAKAIINFIKDKE